ncbi:MAG: sigma factor-like helix-turn-helix DNA-binding protein [Rhodospirillaceae bacterium]
MGEPSAMRYAATVTEAERVELAQYRDPPSYWRPTTRGDCLPGGRNCARPCPYVSCRHHLALEATRRGLLDVFPDMELDDLPETCSLDVADRGPQTLEDIGGMMNVTRERCRQIEARAIRSVKREPPADYLELSRADRPDPGVNRGQKWNRIGGRK